MCINYWIPWLSLFGFDFYTRKWDLLLTQVYMCLLCKTNRLVGSLIFKTSRELVNVWKVIFCKVTFTLYTPCHLCTLFRFEHILNIVCWPRNNRLTMYIVYTTSVLNEYICYNFICKYMCSITCALYNPILY